MKANYVHYSNRVHPHSAVNKDTYPNEYVKEDAEAVTMMVCTLAFAVFVAATLAYTL